MVADPITLEVRALDDLDLEGVRAAWRARYGVPPRLRSVELLKRLLGWRIQSETFGGLSASARRKLQSAGSNRERSLASGIRIAREWQGVRHEVIVRQDGYEYDGRSFSSLSLIAREITGSRWNGPRFFGLRDQNP